MTEFEIVSAIKNYVTAQKAVTNSDIELEQIRDEVDTLRGRLVSELDDAGQFLKPYLSYTQFHKFSTKRDSGSKFVYAELPEIIVGRDNRPFISYAGGSDESSPYRVVVGNQLIYVNDKEAWERKLKTVLYEPGRLVLRNDGPQSIWVRAVFAKPSDLATQGYIWKETRYPCTQKMIDMIIGKTSDSYLRTMYRIPVQPNTQSDNVVAGGGRSR